MKPPFRRSSRALVIAVCVLLPNPLWACATCFGNSDDAMARGMNMGILSLLIVVGFVLSGFGAFAIFLARRSARFASPEAAVEVEPGAGPLIEPPSQPIKQPHSWINS